jgi:ABC-type amino acid transport substrate-binding protein
MSAARINESINRISDFQHLACGVLKGSDAEDLATHFGLNSVPFESLEEALRQLAEKRLQVVVADKISLRFLQRQMARENAPARFEIPAFSIRSSFLAIPVRDGHPDYDRINQSLLKLTASPEWEQMLARWIGADHGGI